MNFYHLWTKDSLNQDMKDVQKVIKFIFAMVKCGELPCTISNIATNLHKPVKSISPTRAQLINKGLYTQLDMVN